MHSTLLIFNPNSDRGRSGQKAADLRAMVDEMGGADWRGTEHPAHAAQIAAEAGISGYKTIVALGGDGTVHEVINGLMKIEALQRPRLGIIPIGSGNDFAHAIGIQKNMQEAMRRVFAGTPKAIDVALIRDGMGRIEYFNNTAGIGFDAAINIQSRSITGLYGFAMYLTATLMTVATKFEAPHLKVTYDGGTLDQPILMFTLGNGPREGGGFNTTPDSKLDDGLIDIVYIQPVSKFRILQLIPKVMNGTHLREPEVKLIHTTHLTLDSDRALPIHLDGELFGPYEADVRHIEMQIMPRAIEVML